jgi:hypothetical protein
MDGQVALSALPPGSILEELFQPGIPEIPETVYLHFNFEEVGIHCCAVVYSELTSTHHDIDEIYPLTTKSLLQ